MTHNREYDFDATFDDDYLYFYAGHLTDELSDADCESIQRLLQLDGSERVLDVPCGHGRIANRLAALGCRVTGADLTELFLARARRDAAARGVEVRYQRADMRELPWEAEFDVAINWFTSFGYFDDAGNRRALASVHRALAPGGRLLLETHPLYAVPFGEVQTSVREVGDDFLIDRKSFDAVSGRWLFRRTAVRGGAVRRWQFFVRLFTYTELRDWLLDAGFAAVEGYGTGGEPFAAESEKMILIAEKAR